MTVGDDHPRRRARLLLAGLALALLVAIVLVSLAGGSRQPAQRRTAAHPLAAAHHRRARSPARPPAQAPGSLPQTHAYPSASSPRFAAAMAALWAGVVADSPQRALGAFFPEAAYVQLKAIASASSDWSSRLVREYALDIGAAHAVLGSGAARATLVTVEVPDQYGHWVEPGTCYNDTGYYEVPNARVVYREDGALRSFGIASMISWRGEWYVVHLGAVLREGEAGVVDEAAAGRGTSAASSTC
jgi:hypothetical protein